MRELTISEFEESLKNLGDKKVCITIVGSISTFQVYELFRWQRCCNIYGDIFYRFGNDEDEESIAVQIDKDSIDEISTTLSDGIEICFCNDMMIQIDEM